MCLLRACFVLMDLLHSGQRWGVGMASVKVVTQFPYCWKHFGASGTRNQVIGWVLLCIMLGFCIQPFQLLVTQYADDWNVKIASVIVVVVKSFELFGTRFAREVSYFPDFMTWRHVGPITSFMTGSVLTMAALEEVLQIRYVLTNKVVVVNYIARVWGRFCQLMHQLLNLWLTLLFLRLRFFFHNDPKAISYSCVTQWIG